MDRHTEYQILTQLKQVTTAADQLLNMFPNETALPELETLRGELSLLKEKMFCPFCGADQIAIPDHISTCPACSGRLHCHADKKRCEDCGYTCEATLRIGLAEPDED